jgi:ATP-dependent DNA ligase
VEFVSGVAASAKAGALGVKAPFPGFIKPALPSWVDRVPSGARWIHEIKFDGYRVQLHLANEAVTVYTRRGYDWTKRFKKVARTSRQDRRSSMARLWSLLPMAAPIFPSFKTS